MADYKHKRRLQGWILLSFCFLLFVKNGSASAGPVFVNPENQVKPTSVAAAPAGLLVTQTVYGFLDFTTTIGNTVMVFSPQSAAPAAPAAETPPPPPPQPQAKPSSVIETKPSVSVVTQVAEAPIVIKPSKTEKKSTGTSKKLSSVVHVVESSKPEPEQPAPIIAVVSSKIEILENVDPPKPSIITKVEVVTNEPVAVKSETSAPITSSHVEVYEASSIPTPVISSVVTEVIQEEPDEEEEEPAVILGNNIGEPEYDFLSRQPSEVVEETYKVINLKPSAKTHKHRPSTIKNKAHGHGATKRTDSQHPTGLVTKLGGTVVKDGVTTVHETSVIGTFISGKYAQVLQSTSHIYNAKQKISPSPTLRILKTAAPALGKKHRHLEPTPAASINEESLLVAEVTQNAIKPTRKPTSSGGFKRFKNRAHEYEDSENESGSQTQEKKTLRSRQQSNAPAQAQSRSFKPHNNTPQHHNNNSSSNKNKYGRNKSQISTVSVSSEQASSSATPTSGKRYNSRRNKQHPRTTSTPTPDNNGGGFTRRGYKPKVQASTVDSTASSSLYKFKLNRSPGRWQYKTTPKPRVTIRKVNDDDANDAATPSSLQEVSPALNDLVTPQARSDDSDGLVGSESVASIVDDESSTENKLDTPFPLETIKVEISTPPDFKDIYYEIATIKSPYTFQVGSVKNTRYITVTSTFEKSLEATSEATIGATATEPLTENILATTSNYDKDNNFLDSSIATLPPLYLAADMETPPLETLTDTFSTTQTMLKTHLLPVIRGSNDTTSYTLVQTYLVTRMVTATKTLPPMEAYHFNPSKTLNEFNSHLDEAGSELHLELEFGDQNEQDDGTIKRILPGDLDLANIGSDFDLSSVDKSRIPEGLKIRKAPPTTPKPQFPDIQTPALSPEQLQQLALYRLLNPQAAPPQGQVITASKPVIKIETVYESHVIPVVNGHNTILSTLSKVIGTVTKTDYEYVTSTLPALPNIPNIQNLPIPPPNPLFPQQQPQFQVTSSPVVQTAIVTQTQSKILKLTFGAKTAYTTIYSTQVVPTLLTSYMTASVPVQPTAAFPGFFPAPYGGFPYVG